MNDKATTLNIQGQNCLDEILTHQIVLSAMRSQRSFGRILDDSRRYKGKIFNKRQFRAMMLEEDKFRIVIARLPDREKCVWKIYYNQRMG
ncbi:unknown protein [Parachlamydia acanthamoebae UV-7]|uniref:Uncharacterized protein n=2 Tax=Parachlamydia acanthamoebae TaxID=83552 RepID=F8KVZ6_PARAV|nr:hypothetical protein DB43_AQ00080 [Parachlamydia acanthamoebae]CCB85298.1 unknown protein [Parachlamydia acanthamoebae UV-7]